MMLRKRSRAAQKDQSLGQLMADSTSDSNLSGATVAPQKIRSTSFFSVPGLFIGFNSKCLSDSDSARSPTSPLDYKVFSNLGNPFVRSPRSSSGVDSPRKSWDCNRVGLGLLDSLNDDPNLPADSKNVIFGSKMRINIPTPKSCLDRTMLGAPASSPKSLPKNYVISSQAFPGSPCFQLCPSQPVFGTDEAQMEAREMGKIQSCSANIGRTSPMPMEEFCYLNPKSNSEEFSFESKKPQFDSSLAVSKVNFGNHPGSLPVSFDSFHGFMGSLSASDIENSEDYTRIISRGPNPKTTHIFGDCILESHASELSGFTNNKRGEVVACEEETSWLVKCSDGPLPPSPAENFLSFCYFCKKKLVDGEDIYIYRGEKAFCSCNCRAQEILIDEESDKPEMSSSDSPRSGCDEEIFLTGMVATI